jgi:4-hydroxy-3-methylbut-2-enyl diphosphate reductase
VLVEELVARLRELGAGEVQRLDGLEEHVRFPLPKGLGD